MKTSGIFYIHVCTYSSVLDGVDGVYTAVYKILVAISSRNGMKAQLVLRLHTLYRRVSFDSGTKILLY